MQATLTRMLPLIALFAIALPSCSKSKRDDLKAPRTVALTPPPDAVDVATDTEIRVVFDVKIRASSLNADTFFLRDIAADAVVGGSLSYDPEMRAAILQPDGALATGTVYEVVLEKSVRSERYGIELRDGRQTWRFTTSAVAASQVAERPIELQLELLAAQFAERAMAEFGPGYLQIAESEQLFAVALPLARGFVLAQHAEANSDFATFLALGMIGEGLAFELLDDLGRTGRRRLMADWGKVPESWLGPLSDRIGDVVESVLVAAAPR